MNNEQKAQLLPSAQVSANELVGSSLSDMKGVRNIKQLQSKLNILLGDVEALKIETARKQREYQQKLADVKRLKDEIKKNESNGKLKISEHAIVRYFERVKGFDISEIEQEILCEDVLIMIEKLGGSGSFPNPKGFNVKMKNNTVVTVI